MSQLTRDHLLFLHPVGILVCGGRPREKTETLIIAMTEEQRKLLPAPDLLPVLSADSLNGRAGLTKEEWNLLIEAPTADAVGVMAIRGLSKVNRAQ